MAKDFDLMSVLEDLTPEDQLEFLREAVSPKAVEAFRAKRASNKEMEAYNAEMKALNTSRMGQYERLNAVMRIKRKYGVS